MSHYDTQVRCRERSTTLPKQLSLAVKIMTKWICFLYLSHFLLKALDPCSTDPCQNGGTCNDDNSGGFTCSCPSGYTGDTCSTSASSQGERLRTLLKQCNFDTKKKARLGAKAGRGLRFVLGFGFKYGFDLSI